MPTIFQVTSRCQEYLQACRALHVPGDPLVLPNASDAATALAVVAAGFPAVATTSGGVAEALGHRDHEAAPPGEMFAAAGRIARSVDVPVTVDAEGGYGLEPAEQAGWLREVREAASPAGLVINARIDVFLAGALAGAPGESQRPLVAEALERARRYLDAGADCVFPIALWDGPALAAFVDGAPGPVNALALPSAPRPAEMAAMGVARISWGTLLHREAMARFARDLEVLAAAVRDPP